MPKGVLFWVLMVLWVVLGSYWNRGVAGTMPGVFYGNLLLFVLLFILGWAVFGFVIQ